MRSTVLPFCDQWEKMASCRKRFEQDLPKKVKEFFESEEEEKAEEKLAKYRSAARIEIAQYVKEIGVDLGAFTIAITRHPQSLPEKWAVENELWGMWQVVQNVKKGIFPKGVCASEILCIHVIEENQQIISKKDYMRLLARLMMINPASIEELKKLQDNPWIKGASGMDYAAFLKDYEEEYIPYQSNQKEKEWRINSGAGKKKNVDEKSDK